MDRYPLLLIPPIKDNLWGGTRLITEYGYQTTGSIAAEAWVLSCHKDGASVVKNGPLSGKTLPEVLTLWGKEALGTRGGAFPYFPLLIKLIDAKQDLSIQVHPDDSYAMAHEGEYGKTEMWYVVDCDPGARLIYGFNRSLSREEFRLCIENNTLPEVCHYVEVHPGDVFFIEAGTLHAIGGGILIAEVQQNSNTTYRVCDFGRLGPDGKPRALHVDKAVDVTHTVPPVRPYGAIGETVSVSGGSKRELASCPLFTAQWYRVENTVKVSRPDSFQSLLFLTGEGMLTDGTVTVSVKKGDSVFLPAGSSASVSGKVEFLYSYV